MSEGTRSDEDWTLVVAVTEPAVCGARVSGDSVLATDRIEPGPSEDLIRSVERVVDNTTAQAGVPQRALVGV